MICYSYVILVQFQPVIDQQIIYSEVTPLNANGNNTLFVLRDDDKVEYAELNHQHKHASNPMRTVAQSNSFGM